MDSPPEIETASEVDSKESSKHYGLVDMLKEIVINDQKQQEGGCFV